MALQLFMHSLRMIFGNLGQALKVSIGPYLVLFAAIAAIILLSGMAEVFINPSLFNLPNPDNIGTFYALMFLVIMPLGLFVIGWVAVSWHRFVLFEEYTRILPAAIGRPIWRYIGKLLLLALIILAIAIPIFSVVGPLLATASASAVRDLDLAPGKFPVLPIGVLVRVGLISTIASLPLYYVSLRLGVALVGTALEKPIGFSEAWRVTRPLAGTIFGVTVLIVMFNFVLSLPTQSLYYAAPVLAEVANLIVTWVTMMLGISILTTLYGHMIEGRPLVS